jgi:hypothetical protein
MDYTFMLYSLNQFSAHNYDQKAVKVGIPIFKNMLFYDPSTSHFQVHSGQHICSVEYQVSMNISIKFSYDYHTMRWKLNKS